MDFLGDFAEDSTVKIYFTTNDGSGGAIAPSTAFEAADVLIYKDGSATQKATTNGMTMTSPFDTITGLHLIVIDTSNDTGDAGFWTIGSDYTAVLSPDETVDGQTVVSVLAQWSIENRTTFPKADYPTNFAALGISGAGVVTEVATLTGHTAQTGDNYARLGAPSGASVSADIAENQTDLNTILADTNELQTDWVDGGRLDLIVDNILTDTAEIGAAGAGLTAVPWNAAWDAEVQSEVEDGLAVYDPPTRAELTTDINSVLAQLPTDAPIEGTADSGSTTTMVDAVRTEADTDYWAGSWILFTSGTISGQVRLITGFTPASDTITFTPATTQAVGTNTYRILPAAYVAEALALTGHTAQTGDNYARLGAPAGASVSADIAENQTDLNTILADTNELQTDWVDGGRLDLIVDATLADTNELQTDDVPGLIAALNDPTAAAIADAVWDEVVSGHATAGTFGFLFQHAEVGQAQTGTLSTTQMSTDLSETTADHYNGRIIVWVTGALARQATDITAYDGAGVLTFTAVTEAPSNSDRFIIF